MPGTPTLIHSLPTTAGTDLVQGGDDAITALANALDAKLTPFSSGLFDDRPVSTPAQPGKAGREYLATDRGVLYKDYGTGWIPLNEEIGNLSWRSIDTIPPGGTHAEANGQAISRANFPLYMSLIGTKHGAGNGSTTVNVFDAGGRVIVGRDVGAVRIPNSPRALGQSGGEERHTLNHDELPFGNLLEGGVGGARQVHWAYGDAAGADIKTNHAGDAHNIMQPYLVLLPLVRIA